MRPTTWSNDRGSFEIERLSDAVVLTTFRGYVQAEALDVLLPALKAELGRGASDYFWDAGEMTGYDTPVRTKITDAFVANRAAATTIHVYTESKLVGMGVAVANLVLGNLKHYTKGAEFRAALAEAQRPRARAGG